MKRNQLDLEQYHNESIWEAFCNLYWLNNPYDFVIAFDGDLEELFDDSEIEFDNSEIADYEFDDYGFIMKNGEFIKRGEVLGVAYLIQNGIKYTCDIVSVWNGCAVVDGIDFSTLRKVE